MIGSFLNLLAYRLPIMTRRDERADCLNFLGLPAESNPPFDLAFPGSHCPSCKTPIKPWHNVPVLGWLVLRGRCAACGVGISARYPLVELACGALSVLVGWRFGVGGQMAAALCLTWGLLGLSVLTWDSGEPSLDVTLPLLWLGLLWHCGGVFASAEAGILGALLGFLTAWLFYRGLGLANAYADSWACAMLGAWLGWRLLPWVALFALPVYVGLEWGVSRRFAWPARRRFVLYAIWAGWALLLAPTGWLNHFVD